MTHLIDAQHVTYTIESKPILRDVSLTLNPGEFVGLIGPNGAGKSTLLRVLGGLWSGTEGAIHLKGHLLNSYTPREVAMLVAHVPQDTVVDFAFTAREIVLMGRSPHLGRFEVERAEDRTIADEAMQRMDVLSLADRFVNTLSGGERQRVFIARALAQQASVLLLDEPTANLDVKHQLDVLTIVQRLARDEGLGVIAAIHDLDLAAQFVDRLVMLHEGRMIVDDVPDAVLTPKYLSATFGVDARPYHDPFTGALRLSLGARNGHQGTHHENGHKADVPKQKVAEIS